MGRASLEGMLEMIDRNTALGWHLQSNHFPPHPAEMIPVAAAAIDATNVGDNNRLIDLFEGVTWRDGRSAVEAWRLVDSLHLDAFIEPDEFYDD